MSNVTLQFNVLVEGNTVVTHSVSYEKGKDKYIPFEKEKALAVEIIKQLEQRKAEEEIYSSTLLGWL